jgi:hypothetical protein
VEPTYKFLSTSHHPRVNPFTRSEDESVSRVLCVLVLAPTEGLGPTLAVARTGQCEDIGRMKRVGLGWNTWHGIWVGTGAVPGLALRVRVANPGRQRPRIATRKDRAWATGKIRCRKAGRVEGLVMWGG